MQSAGAPQPVADLPHHGTDLGEPLEVGRDPHLPVDVVGTTPAVRRPCLELKDVAVGIRGVAPRDRAPVRRLRRGHARRLGRPHAAEHGIERGRHVRDLERDMAPARTRDIGTWMGVEVVVREDLDASVRRRRDPGSRRWAPVRWASVARSPHPGRRPGCRARAGRARSRTRRRRTRRAGANRREVTLTCPKRAPSMAPSIARLDAQEIRARSAVAPLHELAGALAAGELAVHGR